MFLLRLTVLLFFVGSAFGSSCLERVVPNGICAILYGKENCGEGEIFKQPFELVEGEQNLSDIYNNKAESVRVNKGCTFRGYDNEREPGQSGLFSLIGEKSIEQWIDRNDKVSIVPAPVGESAWADFKGDMKKAISFVSCTCGNSGNCPVVPHYLCAIAYDKVGCDVGAWNHPLEIPVIDRMNLGLITAFKYRNDIESVSVRKGCTFKGFRDTDLNAKDGDVVIAAPPNQDLQKDLTDNELANAIESLSCTCA